MKVENVHWLNCDKAEFFLRELERLDIKKAEVRIDVFRDLSTAPKKYVDKIKCLETYFTPVMVATKPKTATRKQAMVAFLDKFDEHLEET